MKLLDLSEADYADYVVIDTVQMLMANNRLYAYDGDRQVRVFNTLGVKGLKSPSSIDGKYFNLTGIYGTHLVEDELIDELYLMASPVEVEAPTAIRTVSGTPLRIGFDGDQLLLSGLTARVPVTVYRVDGHVVATTTASAHGTALLNAAHWPAGVYLVKAEGQVVKVQKR